MINDDIHDDKEFFVSYIASVYWAMSTVSTVGYGDISAFTKAERTYAIVFMIIGLGIFNFT